MSYTLKFLLLVKKHYELLNIIIQPERVILNRKNRISHTVFNQELYKNKVQEMSETQQI